MATPLISVIVPVYKVEDYLDRCVSSILNQSITDFELILVDDCSPDESGNMCDEYARQDKRVRVIHHEKNVGLSGARNTGINAANGAYLSFIDSDDWVSLNFLESLSWAAKESKSEIAACRVVKVASKHTGKTQSSPPPEIISTFSPKEALINLFTAAPELQHVAWNKLYKRSLFNDNIRYPEGFLHEDVLTTYKVIAEANQVCYIEFAHYNYFLRDESIVRGKFNPKRLEALPEFDKIQGYLKERGFSLENEVEYFEYLFTLHFLNEMHNSKVDETEQRRLRLALLSKKNQIIKNPYMTLPRKVQLYSLNSYLIYKMLTAFFQIMLR